MSLINISEERLLELGVRFRLDYLSEQAGYTLGLAGRDSQELSAYLPAGLMDEAHALWETVRAKAADKKFAAEEARAATREQNRLFRNAKLWRRRVANLAASASHLGTEMPAGLLVYASARTVPALLSQMENMLKLLDENKTRLPQAAGDLIAEGRSLADGLRSQDAFQEQKRLSELPRATRDINIVKGKLYSAIKAINDIGRTVFAGEPRKAAEYNLSILHRDTGPRKKPAAENK